MPEAYEHVSLDIETLGLEPGCVILSIGLTPFNIGGIDEFFTLLGRTKHWAISRETTDHYRVDQDTLAWHLNNRQRASMLDYYDQIARPLVEVLEQVVENIDPAGFVWANSPSFDCSILKHVLNREKVSIPWHFSRELDLRTALYVANINKQKIKPAGFVPHRADHDAAYQAHLIQMCCHNHPIKIN